MRHPDQPIVRDSNGIIRFAENAIVRRILGFSGAHGCALNELCMMEFSDADWSQFYQLIGNSVDGYCDLSNVSDESKTIALDRYLAFQEGIDQSPTEIVESRWVSTKVRMPPREQVVLVSCGEHGSTVAYLGPMSGRWMSTIAGTYIQWIVTHWMPLPEPPKESKP